MFTSTAIWKRICNPFATAGILITMYILLLRAQLFSSLLSPHWEYPSHSWHVGIHSPLLTHWNVLFGHAVHSTHRNNASSLNHVLCKFNMISSKHLTCPKKLMVASLFYCMWRCDQWPQTKNLLLTASSGCIVSCCLNRCLFYKFLIFQNFTPFACEIFCSLPFSITCKSNFCIEFFYLFIIKIVHIVHIKRRK